MNERLKIENFGPIKEMSFEFKKINILIGEQSTGKSTVAKLVAAINKMATGETLAAGSSGMMREDEYGKPEHFKRHLKVYEIESYLNELTIIDYQHTLFDFKFINGNCFIKKTKTTGGEDVSLDWLSTTFIPADRIAVNLLSNEVLYTFNEINQDLPGYFIRFGRLFSRLKKDRESFDFSDTLGVVYRYENNLDKIEIFGDKQIKMTDASSAIQTNIPLLVILNSQSQTDGRAEFYSSDINITIIEEPELNCFPSLQNSVIKYIVRCIRSSQNEYKRRSIITTHSPYILTSLNNLMYAYQVGQTNSEEANNIIKDNYWLNPNDVSAYMMLLNGEGEDIMDREEGMIKAEKIDEVSRKLNQQFDDLLTLEYSKK
jgi:predicted ATP-dependent endonuclease of OLD family